MFADEVFVFSPRGDVTNLPAGATPIDFAYSIHSAIGNRMTGAKVNGRIAPLDYQLKNGDIVEILTSKSAHGPSRDWLKIAKSSEARSKIRQWFKKERREENIINGRISFEAELKHLGIPMSDVLGTDIEAALLKKTSFGSMDEMYAAIGYGGFSAQKAVNRIHDEIVKLEKQRKEERAATVPVDNSGATRPAIPKRTKSEQGIVVEGLSNCLVKFSKCCTPVPGDEIVGFITRGYGVSVHRCDCPNAAHRAPQARGARPLDQGQLGHGCQGILPDRARYLRQGPPRPRARRFRRALVLADARGVHQRDHDLRRLSRSSISIFSFPTRSTSPPSCAACTRSAA